MNALVVVRQDDPILLLEELRRIPDASALLLGPAQALKPGALAALERWTGRRGPVRIRADAHPDLDLDAYGRWLQSSNAPPFGPGTPRQASVWGLLGSARDFAAALSQGLERCPPGGDWQPAFLAGLSGGPATVDESGSWIFQTALPSLSEALEGEARRARTWAGLLRQGALPSGVEAPPRGADVPSEWRSAAESLAAVPLGALKGVQVSGHAAADLVGGLGKVAFNRAFELAFAQGWHRDRAGAPAVAKGLKRVAVVYPAYGGSLNLARRSAEALERLGYEVQRVDPSRHEKAVAEAQLKGDAGLFRALEQECLTALAGGRPQWIWILAQAPLSLGALRSLRRQGARTAYWFCEDYRVRPVWRDLAPEVDAFFPMQGGAFVSALEALGVPVFAPLPACAASDACRQGADGEIPTRPLTFFGAPYANRLRFFEALADLPLELFGEGWDRHASALLQPLVRDASRLSEAQGFELFRRSAVNLNLHSSPFTHGIDPAGDYVNPRTFEIAACGGFQLCDRRRDLGAAFEEGREIEAFSSVAELREKIARWSEDPGGRARVASAARRRVLAEHTYEHRLGAALAALGLDTP